MGIEHKDGISLHNFSTESNYTLNTSLWTVILVNLSVGVIIDLLWETYWVLKSTKTLSSYLRIELSISILKIIKSVLITVKSRLLFLDRPHLRSSFTILNHYFVYNCRSNVYNWLSKFLGLGIKFLNTKERWLLRKKTHFQL